MLKNIKIIFYLFEEKAKKVYFLIEHYKYINILITERIHTNTIHP